MSNRSLNPKTRQLLKDWYLGNLSPQGEIELINSLIGELNQTKVKQVNKLEIDYYR